LDFELIPYMHLDINANYRFENWDDDKFFKDVDTDTVTVGAVVRFEF
jgi:opacity protein-like surface antigen